MPKQYVKLRIGLLDHMPRFAQNPDAYLLWSWCLLQAPISGPDSGCVFINQASVAERWGWSRSRVTKAIRWLQSNPSMAHPLLVRVEKGAKNRPGRYAIPRFEHIGKHAGFSSAQEPNRNRFSSDSAPLRNRIHGFSSDSAPLRNRNSNKERARQKERESLEQEGCDAMRHETGSWIVVRDEDEAVLALMQHRGFANLPDSIQSDALTNALKNLEHYRIRYEPEDEPKAAAR